LGIDPNESWGRTRYILFAIGLALICMALYFITARGRQVQSIKRLTESEHIKFFVPLVHAWVAVILIYMWFVTFGNFSTWNHTSRYYSLLADAFAKRQLYVDINPGKALLDAPDPYDPESRQPFQDEIWDMSYYKGKLYYYWGPVPALIIVPLQLILHRKISDIYLVFFFSVGIFLFNSLIILRLWRRFFAHLPAWRILISIVLTGLTLPIVWDLSVPYVYEAAIGASQFFMMGGIYFALTAIRSDPPFKNKMFFLAGFFWACCVGSRAINALPVVFMAFLISYWILKAEPRPIRWARIARALSGLYLPLLFGAIAIGWYNWARFGSPLEFGLRYQITTFNLNEKVNLVFHPDYFFLNLYAYLFQPFELISKFPFLQPVIFSSILYKHGIAQPSIYYAGRVTGLIISAPFLILGLIPLLSKKGFSNPHEDSPEGGQPYRKAIALLAGSFLIGLLTILFYFTAQERFLVDSISQITLLAILGYWTLLYRAQQSSSVQSRALVCLANAFLIFTICASLLLAVSSETNRIETLNPLLLEKINIIFGR
ncbi:MAG: hypothetical protein Q7J80_02280, partial [Anaerolineales bacterium]|nr:hypothetical protein [Anaerolineales bacterium]